MYVTLTENTSIDVPEDHNLFLITQGGDSQETESGLAKKIMNDFAFSIKCKEKRGFRRSISKEEVADTIDALNGQLLGN